MVVHEKDFFYSPAFSANSKIKPGLLIDNEVNFSNPNNDLITFFNSDSNNIKDKVSLINRSTFREIIL